MNTLNKLVIIITLATTPVIAQQYTTLGSTYSFGRGPTLLENTLTMHLSAATTKQIHDEEALNQYVYTTCLYTMISTGTKFGTAIQSVSGVSAGFSMSNSADLYPMSTMTCVAIMYWIYRDTYPAAAASEEFTFSTSQQGGGLILGCCGDLDEVVAAQNNTIGFAYNPNGTGYDFFQGTCPVKNDGKWHHVIHVVDRYAGKMKQFIDGVKDFNSITLGLEHTITKLTAPTNVAYDVSFGSLRGVASKFQGRLDEFVILRTSSRSFSDAECYNWYRQTAGRYSE